MKKLALIIGIYTISLHPSLFAQNATEQNGNTPAQKNDAEAAEIPTKNQDPQSLAAEAATSVSKTKRDLLFQKVDTLRRNFVEKRSAHTTSAIRRLTQALASDEATFDLYLEAVEFLEFENRDRKASEFKQWKKNNTPLLRSREGKQALRLQLLHLMAAFKAGLADDIRDAFPAANQWIQYYNEVESSLSYPRTENRRESGRVKSITNKSLYGTYFARYFDLKKIVEIPKGWPQSPKDIDGFFRNVLLPICREKGDWPGIDKAWSIRLSAIRSIAQDREEREDKTAWEKLMKNTYPALLWERAIDRIAFGPNAETGLKEASDVITTYFDHPNMPNWFEQFTRLTHPEEPNGGTETNEEMLESIISSLRPPKPPSVLKENDEKDPEEDKIPITR